MKFKSPIFALWLTVFIDLLGIGIVIPIFASLFFIPGSDFFQFKLIIGDTKISTQVLYGFLIASYPIFQFFGAPILGDLSDNFGRKKLLMISIFGTLLGYIIIAVGIINQNIFLVFLGRILDGFTGGNISVAQSSISDLSTNENKARNFGLIGLAFGLGFVLGPYIGGKLSDSNNINWFNNSTPFFFASILTGINLILIYFYYSETLRVKKEFQKIIFFKGFKNILKITQSNSKLKKLLLVNFFFAFGFNFFTQFFQVFLIYKFAFSSSQIGDIFAYIGIWIAITQGFILRPLVKKFIPQNILKISLLFLGFSFLLLLIPNKSIYLFVIIPIISIFNGISQPNLTTLISNTGDEKIQGEILGINQSIQSLAQAIPPIVAGFISTIAIELPILVASIFTLLAWATFLLLVFNNQQSKNNNKKE